MPVWDRQVLEQVLLGLLTEQPAHGYELAAHFQPGGDLEDIARFGKSQLYDALNGLERRGDTVSSFQEESGGPTRKVFSVTTAGRERFDTWLRAPVASIRALRLEFVFKLYFHRRLGIAGVEGLLEAQTEQLERRMAEVDAAAVPGSTVAIHVRSLQRQLLVGALRWLVEERQTAGSWARNGGAR